MSPAENGPVFRPLSPQKPASPARAPSAFALKAAGDTIVEEPDFTLDTAQPALNQPPPAPKTLGLMGLIWVALGLLLTLYLGEAAADLVARLSAKSPYLALTALGALAILALGLVVFLAREALALFRLRKVETLREAARLARLRGREREARGIVEALVAFYAKDPLSAAGAAQIKAASSDILDAASLLDLAERALLARKDQEARREIASAAQRVSVFTALSPRALLDIAFVLGQAVQLIRRLSQLYGGRASGLGLWRLSARVGVSLVLTGGTAMAESLLGHAVGAGLAARLSAKFGEGVLNGILVARIGIAAAQLCRPLAFEANAPILLSEVVKLSATP